LFYFAKTVQKVTILQWVLSTNAGQIVLAFCYQRVSYKEINLTYSKEEKHLNHIQPKT
jgi:hypothetical protein